MGGTKGLSLWLKRARTPTLFYSILVRVIVVVVVVVVVVVIAVAAAAVVSS
jgi:hypothetical protein